MKAFYTDKKYLFVCLLFMMCHKTICNAAIYSLYNNKESVVGELSTTYSSEDDTLLDVARRNGLGYQDIKLFNPSIDTWLPGEGKEIQLPSKFILPNTKREGLVLNIPEMRLYFYTRDENDQPVVETYPLGVGREGWSTPYMETKIIEKKENPKWYPPKSILKEHEEAGDPLPDVVEAGPDNPLGAFAMRLGRPEYLIHGTNKPFGIGMRVSHGCIRLYPEDIEELFQKVSLGTRVEIVNQPFKVGERDGILYLEAHPYLEEDGEIYHNNLTPIIELIVSETNEGQFDIDWDKVRKAAREPIGIPTPIGFRVINTNQEPDSVIVEKTTIQPGKEKIASNNIKQTNADELSTKKLQDITTRAIQHQENKLNLRLDLMLDN